MLHNVRVKNRVTRFLGSSPPADSGPHGSATPGGGRASPTPAKRINKKIDNIDMTDKIEMTDKIDVLR